MSTSSRLIMLALLSSAACSAHRYSTAEYLPNDPNTEYAVEEAPDGFTIHVYYSCYQFFPAYGSAVEAGKSAIRALAHEEAAKRGRTLGPIDSENIMWNTGRDGWGNTSWSGKLRCRYATREK